MVGELLDLIIAEGRAARGEAGAEGSGGPGAEAPKAPAGLLGGGQ